MSSGFAELTRQAQNLVLTGDLAGAQDLLSDALDTADPRPETASPELTEAASLQARVTVTLGEPHAAHGWAAFAYSAASRLFGPSDQRTIAAAATLAAVLHRVGDHSRAALLYRDVIIELTTLDGPESLRVLAGHADLATVEYAQGACTLARNRLTDAWELHREIYGEGHLSGIRMLARLGAMERDCGRSGEAQQHLTLARQLCREHLPADHPLATQISTLSRAAANPEHICADVPAEAPPGQIDGPSPEPAYPPEPPAEPGYQPPPQNWWPPDAGAEWSDAPSAFGPESTGPAPVERTLGAEPAGLPAIRQPPEHRLPVIYHPPRKPGRRMLPIVLGGLIVMLLGAGAVVVGFALVDGSPPTPDRTVPATVTPSATTAPSTAPQSPPATTGSPPTGVTLRDNRQSVALSWTYPAGAEGPIVVAGGRRGQQPQAFQELPAGSNSFTVYGLNSGLDYCFTVAVVYSVDTAGRSKPVCTSRATGSPGR